MGNDKSLCLCLWDVMQYSMALPYACESMWRDTLFIMEFFPNECDVRPLDALVMWSCDMFYDVKPCDASCCEAMWCFMLWSHKWFVIGGHEIFCDVEPWDVVWWGAARCCVMWSHEVFSHIKPWDILRYEAIRCFVSEAAECFCDMNLLDVLDVKPWYALWF